MWCGNNRKTKITVCLTNAKKFRVMFEKYKQEFDSRALTRKKKVLPFFKK